MYTNRDPKGHESESTMSIAVKRPQKTIVRLPQVIAQPQKTPHGVPPTTRHFEPPHVGLGCPEPTESDA